MSDKSRVAMSPEARRQQICSEAYDEAQRQIRNHTASSQVLTHFLKLGSRKEQLEIEILEEQKKLICARTEDIKNNANNAALFEKALQAMSMYQGNSSGDDDEEL